jgi:hypothetical protein
MQHNSMAKQQIPLHNKLLTNGKLQPPGFPDFFFFFFVIRARSICPKCTAALRLIV